MGENTSMMVTDDDDMEPLDLLSFQKGNHYYDGLLLETHRAMFEPQHQQEDQTSLDQTEEDGHEDLSPLLRYNGSFNSLDEAQTMEMKHQHHHHHHRTHHHYSSNNSNSAHHNKFYQQTRKDITLDRGLHTSSSAPNLKTLGSPFSFVPAEDSSSSSVSRVGPDNAFAKPKPTQWNTATASPREEKLSLNNGVKNTKQQQKPKQPKRKVKTVAVAGPTTAKKYQPKKELVKGASAPTQNAHARPRGPMPPPPNTMRGMPPPPNTMRGLPPPPNAVRGMLMSRKHPFALAPISQKLTDTPTDNNQDAIVISSLPRDSAGGASKETNLAVSPVSTTMATVASAVTTSPKDLDHYAENRRLQILSQELGQDGVSLIIKTFR